MKSYIAMFSDLYEALSRDLVQTFPTLEAGVERDLTRLRRALSHEGLGFITLTHLEMNAAFRQALAVGDLSIGVGSKPPRGFGASSSIDVRPKYLHGLMGLVFDEKGMLLQNPDTNAIAFISQWLLAGKKIELECSDEPWKRPSQTSSLSMRRCRVLILTLGMIHSLSGCGARDIPFGETPSTPTRPPIYLETLSRMRDAIGAFLEPCVIDLGPSWDRLIILRCALSMDAVRSPTVTDSNTSFDTGRLSCSRSFPGITMVLATSE